MSGRTTFRALVLTAAVAAVVVLGPGSSGAGAQQHLRTQDPAFALDCAPRDVPVPQGGSGYASCTVVSLLQHGEPVVPVQLRCEALPPGMGCTFNPNPVIPLPEGAPSALEITADTAVPPGQYPIAVVGTDGLDTLSVPMVVTVAMPRAQCKCVSLDIAPTKPAKGKQNPVVTAAAHPTDQDKYKITVTVNWTAQITCDNSGADDCTADYKAGYVTHNDWMVDGFKAKSGKEPRPEDLSGEPVSETINAPNPVTCKGKCGPDNLGNPNQTTANDLVTTYEAVVGKKGGGKIGKGITGTIELTMTPQKCPGRTAKMILAFRLNLAAGTAGFDLTMSDFDGDGKMHNDKKGKPLDPDDYDPTK